MKLEQLQQTVRELATLEENDSMVVSCYVRPSEDGLAGDPRFQERIRSVRGSLPADRREEFDASIHQILAYVEAHPVEEAKSAAFFVRQGRDPFFHALTFQVETESAISVDWVPNIFQLVEMKDRYHRYVVLLFTHSILRVMEVNLGAVTTEVWRERPELRRRVGREWTRHHYQRHAEAVNERFLKEALEVLQRRMARGGYRHLILAGNSPALAQIENSLPRNLREALVERLVVEPSDAVEEVVGATLRAFLEEEQRESGDRVVELEHHLHKTGLATAGLDETRTALETGAADVLVIASDLEPRRREELVRLAEMSSAAVEVVDDDATLARLGGVGCLLRYQAWDFGSKENDDPRDEFIRRA